MQTAQLNFITPSTIEELTTKYLREITFLKYSLPEIPPTDADQLSWLHHLGPSNHTLIYANNTLIALVSVAPHKHAAELYGIFSKNLPQQFPDTPKPLKKAVAELILPHLFVNEGKKKLFVKVLPDHKAARGFANMHGFKKLQYQDKGRNVSVLPRASWLSRDPRQASLD